MVDASWMAAIGGFMMQKKMESSAVAETFINIGIVSEPNMGTKRKNADTLVNTNANESSFSIRIESTG
jgi:hypothetical protein